MTIAELMVISWRMYIDGNVDADIDEDDLVEDGLQDSDVSSHPMCLYSIMLY